MLRKEDRSTAYLYMFGFALAGGCDVLEGNSVSRQVNVSYCNVVGGGGGIGSVQCRAGAQCCCNHYGCLSTLHDWRLSSITSYHCILPTLFHTNYVIVSQYFRVMDFN